MTFFIYYAIASIAFCLGVVCGGMFAASAQSEPNNTENVGI